VGTIYPTASEHGITVIGPEIVSLTNMSAADYLTSVPIEDAESS
jgi:hypothetical protein